MAAAVAATASFASSSQLYQQALALLQQQKFDHAFVAAKRALDSAGGAAQAQPRQTADGGLLLCAQCWQAMATAAAGMGDTEVAYCLYAKGYEQCQLAAAAAATAVLHATLQAVVQQLAAGKLQMLAALCAVPGDKQQQQQQHTCKRWQRTQERFHLCPNSSSSSRRAAGSRVFCVSDLHVDKAGGANMAWVQRISGRAFSNDVLIVAGDVADTATATAAALRALSSRFKRVIWLPGNHEAWLRPGSRDAELYTDSFAKLLALRQMADECGADVGPVEVAPGLIVLPLLSWYRAAFDTSDPRPGRYRHDSFCSWPVPDDDVWQVMMRLNSRALALVQGRTAQLQQAAMQQSKEQQQQQHVEQGQQQLAAPALAKQQQQPAHCEEPPVLTSATTASITGHSSSNGSSSSSSVTWNEQGVLAVKSSRRVPGLQLNLKSKPTPARGAGQQQQQHKTPPQQQQWRQQHHSKQQLSAVRDAAPAAAAAAVAGSAPTRPLQLQPAAPALLLQSAADPGLIRAPPTIRSTMPVPTAAAAAAAAVTLNEPAGSAAAGPAAAAAAAAAVTVITASHFLPHPQLPHSRFSELGKAMGCCELQLQLDQVSSLVHVYGHSHVNADMDLPTAAALHTTKFTRPDASRSEPAKSSSSSRRYVQYALDAVGAEAAGLYCIWDGSSLAAPGMVVPVTGP